MNIQEDYVSFETAELLKEKGFPQSTLVCNTVYKPNGRISNNAKSFISPCYIDKDIYVFAPTLQMAMKWLREVHYIAINIGWGEIFEKQYQWWSIALNMCNGNILYDGNYCPSYEEAVESALKYCLKNWIQL